MTKILILEKAVFKIINFVITDHHEGSECHTWWNLQPTWNFLKKFWVVTVFDLFNLFFYTSKFKLKINCIENPPQ